MDFDHSIEPREGVNVSLQVFDKETFSHSDQLLGMLFNLISIFSLRDAILLAASAGGRYRYVSL